jgi:hypothetical protein
MSPNPSSLGRLAVTPLAFRRASFVVFVPFVVNSYSLGSLRRTRASCHKRRSRR